MIHDFKNKKFILGHLLLNTLRDDIVLKIKFLNQLYKDIFRCMDIGIVFEIRSQYQNKSYLEKYLGKLGRHLIEKSSKFLIKKVHFSEI